MRAASEKGKPELPSLGSAPIMITITIMIVIVIVRLIEGRWVEIVGGDCGASVCRCRRKYVIADVDADREALSKQTGIMICETWKKGECLMD